MEVLRLVGIEAIAEERDGTEGERDRGSEKNGDTFGAGQAGAHCSTRFGSVARWRRVCSSIAVRMESHHVSRSSPLERTSFAMTPLTVRVPLKASRFAAASSSDRCTQRSSVISSFVMRFMSSPAGGRSLRAMAMLLFIDGLPDVSNERSSWNPFGAPRIWARTAGASCSEYVQQLLRARFLLSPQAASKVVRSSSVSRIRFHDTVSMRPAYIRGCQIRVIRGRGGRQASEDRQPARGKGVVVRPEGFEPPTLRSEV